MKRFSNDGFTLVELMVVVSIIGILSAVAIPNFKSYQAKSKTSEAKLQLASMYSAETALQSDYDAYGACLVYAGYSAPTGGRNYYAVGFPAGGSAGVPADANALVDQGAGAGACVTEGIFNVDAGRQVAGVAITEANLGITAPANMLDASIASKTAVGVGSSGEWFILGAAGIINSSAQDATNADEWVIDENKLLLNAKSGVNL